MGGEHKDYKYYKGYDMKKKGEGEKEKNYWSEEVSSAQWGSDIYTDRNTLLVYFLGK